MPVKFDTYDTDRNIRNLKTERLHFSTMSLLSTVSKTVLSFCTFCNLPCSIRLSFSTIRCHSYTSNIENKNVFFYFNVHSDNVISSIYK